MLRVFVSVPQAYAPDVTAGIPGDRGSQGTGHATHAAKVTRTAIGLDPGSRTLLAQVDIPNGSHRLLPGMFVYVSLQDRPFRHRVAHSRQPPLSSMPKGTRVAVIDAGNRLQVSGPVTVGKDSGAIVDVQAGS